MCVFFFFLEPLGNQAHFIVAQVTDDGIELIAENLRKLRCLDLSWCPRVTDAALEYIACDLGHLDELILDR